jgi:hypothetical protein
MLTIAEKPEFMKARTVKVCTKTVNLSSPGFKSLVFRINPQENCIRREKLDSSGDIFIQLLDLNGANYVL